MDILLEANLQDFILVQALSTNVGPLQLSTL